MSKQTRILAIETALGKPSISVLEGNRELGFWVGAAQISASANLLSAISDLLSKLELKIQGLNLIAVSRGPGSFTGIRVGLATAQALAFGAHLKCCGIDTLSALNLMNFQVKSDLQANNLIAVIAAGNREIYWQKFKTNFSLEKQDESVSAGLCKIEKFIEKLKTDLDTSKTFRVVADAQAFEQLESFNIFSEENAKFIRASDNVAEYIGLSALGEAEYDTESKVEDNLAPLYFRDYRIGGK